MRFPRTAAAVVALTLAFASGATGAPDPTQRSVLGATRGLQSWQPNQASPARLLPGNIELEGDRRVASSPFEVLLEHSSVAEVLHSLIPRYPQVEFRLHPTMNGFYAKGSRDDLLGIKKSVGELDRQGFTSPLPAHFPLRHLPAQAAVEAMKHWVPAADCVAEESSIVHRGPKETNGDVVLALLELDHSSVYLNVLREKLAQAPTGRCRIPERHQEFECSAGDCGGVLHLTGLQPGDVFLPKSREHPYAPFWVVYRNRERVNIFVEFR